MIFNLKGVLRSQFFFLKKIITEFHIIEFQNYFTITYYVQMFMLFGKLELKIN
jgi:hypothetical protein